MRVRTVGIHCALRSLLAAAAMAAPSAAAIGAPLAAAIATPSSAAIAALPAAAIVAPPVAPPAGQDATAAQVMQSVFGNRVRDGGFWRQDNDAYEPGADAPKYWMQVWRNGPGDEIVIVDAYAVAANDTCSPLIHIVYRYDPEARRIRSDAYGANGVSGQGVVAFEGSVTSSEVTLQLPGRGEVRMRDHEVHGAAVVVVQGETWDGEEWVAADPASWRRSVEGLPCGGAGGG